MRATTLSVVLASFMAAASVQLAAAENCWCGDQVWKGGIQGLYVDYLRTSVAQDKCSVPRPDTVPKQDYCIGANKALCCDDCRELPSAGGASSVTGEIWIAPRPQGIKADKLTKSSCAFLDSYGCA